ncbi:MAG TPA: hypothetical protein VGC66_13615 [Pyrinomonadaceae bacterium]
MIYPVALSKRGEFAMDVSALYIDQTLKQPESGMAYITTALRLSIGISAG